MVFFLSVLYSYKLFLLMLKIRFIRDICNFPIGASLYGNETLDPGDQIFCGSVPV